MMRWQTDRPYHKGEKLDDRSRNGYGHLPEEITRRRCFY
jgi:hypothetical protein